MIPPTTSIIPPILQFFIKQKIEFLVEGWNNQINTSVTFTGIALATYFLRLQIIILMRGKRSLHPTEVSISKVLQNLARSWDEYQ